MNREGGSDGVSCPPHPADRAHIRRKKRLGGGEAFVLQCLACGRQVGGPIALSAVPDPRTVRRWDERLAHRAQPTKRKREYHARFKRPDWTKRLRPAVLARDNYTCQRCGEIATDVGHRTYERFGEERLSDLEAQSRECNLAEREQRITRSVLGADR